MISTVNSKNGKVIRLTDERLAHKLKSTAEMQGKPRGARIGQQHWRKVVDKGEMVLYVGGQYGKGYFRAT